MAKKNHVTFALQINNRPNRFGQYAIYIRITQDRKFRHIKTSVQVSNKALFNKNARNENWIRQTDLEFAKKNATLAHELGEAKKAYVDLIEEDKVVTLNAIAEKTVEAPISGSFMQFFKEFNDSLHAGGQIRYWKQFNDVYNKIMVFMKKCRMKDVLFSDLTPKFIDRFVRHLSTLPNQRHPDQVLHKNTIQNVLKRFRTLTRRAVKLGYMSYDKDPFLNYQFHWITTTKDKLDSDEINRIMALELIEDSPLWHTRNCFLFSFTVLVLELETYCNFDGAMLKGIVWFTEWEKTTKNVILFLFRKQ